MFGRVAAWCFAAFLVVVPVASGVETAADAPAGQAAIAASDQLQYQSAPARDTSAEAFSNRAALEPAEPYRPGQAMPEPFGLAAVPVAAGGLVTKWSGVEADIRNDHEILARCRDRAERCPGSARSFLAIVAEGRAQNGRGRIGVINRAINMAIQPMSDLAQWGVPDRWSAPLETFTTRRGDCEDYAIAKYVALTEAGFSAEDVRLVVVRNTAVGEDHAVAAVRFDGRWIMLDNRWLTLIEDTEMAQVIPLFVLDEEGVRRFAPAAMSSTRRTAAPASLGF